jgi:[protein-PII] uridylyltransferase
MGTRERRERSDTSDIQLVELFSGALALSGVSEEKIALTAVGGYGRGELAPGSDLDLLILHSGLAEAQLQSFVTALLNPLWSAGRAVDYSIRTKSETRKVASEDFKVAMGLLDLRFLAGATWLAREVEEEGKRSWQRNIVEYLPALRQSIDKRAERSGELAYLLEPDLKESRGGLRDIQALKAIAKADYVAVEMSRLAEAESLIANTRDALHEVSKRNRDQLLLTEQDRVAEILGYRDADALMLALSRAARSVDYVMSLTLHRIDHLEKPSRSRTIFPRRKVQAGLAIAKGLQSINGELTLSDEHFDAGLGIRAAAAAAQRGLRLSVETALQISEHFTPLPEPWPRLVREDFVAMLGAGVEMLDVFEALDQEGLIEKWIPEWSHVRFLPQRNVLHHHTVDRHMLQTVVQAAALTRRVHRPDILLVVALLHDIGKGYEGLDHSDYGAELIYPMALRIGFDQEDAELMEQMVKHHLLLSAVATRRDLDDPQTIEYVKSEVKSAELLELLHALAIADGEATGKTAWSSWKAGLVADLVRRTLASMNGVAPASRVDISDRQLEKIRANRLSIELEKVPESDGFMNVEIISPDRAGLLSTVAAVLSISKMDVRSAKTQSVESHAVMRWLVKVDVNAPLPTPESIADKLERALKDPSGLKVRIDERIATHRRNPGFIVPPPMVTVLDTVATDASIVEVRMHDQPGILYTVTKAISASGFDIRGAIVATLGAEAFDTIYVAKVGGGALNPQESQALTLEIELALASSRLEE